ncbi:MAG: extracellular solute-binding protein family 1 [Herbinix sp.]|jgi:arabinogalactan oligomer/maltooligosaccharide transport system substrate-binding protein|nr:extracellular solute-binding protein family 1 [Herbinix sp.]
MRYLKRLLVIVMVFTMVTMSFAGCAKKSGDDTSTTEGTDTPAATTETVTTAPEATTPAVQDVALKVWAPEEEQEILVQMCDAFAENHPEYNITFEYAIMGVDDSITELKKDATVAADVFMYPSGGIAELVEAGLIYPITVNADQVIASNGAGAIKSCTLDDTLYGIPVTPNSWFMYYNKSMYTEDEVKSLETMLAKDLGSDVKNFSCDIDNSWYMSAFFYAPGGTLFGKNGDDPTQCSWNDATGYQVGQYLINLVNSPNYVEDADGLAGSLMAEGKLAALCSGTWSADSIKEALGDNYAACKLPTINVGGTDYQLSNFADFKAFGVNTNTLAPKPAMELAEWLGGEESQLIRFETNNTPPTILSLIENPQVAASQEVAALSSQTNFSTPNPTTSKLNDYWTPAAAFGAGVVNGDITEANLQESLDAMVNSFLATLAN